MTLRIGACDCDDVDAATYLVERLVGNISWGGMKNRRDAEL